MDYKSFQTELFKLADDGYREFAEGGTPTKYPFLGVRLPYLRDFAKKIVKSGEAEELLRHDPKSFEEVTTQAIVLAMMPYEQMKSRLIGFVKKIDNWGTCDTFCNTAKSVREHRDDFLEVIDEFLEGSEFETRVALVMLLCYYVDEDYIHVIFDRVMAVKDRGEYYVKMAAAWLIAECFIKFPDETYPILNAKVLPKFVQNKTISKIRDSFRVPEEVKDHLVTLRVK